MKRTPELQYFAAVGDVHGNHRRMLRLLTSWEKRRKRSLDFVLQVGDFEPHRHNQDLHSMAAPSRLKHLGDWPLFHQQRQRLPWPLWFIGGNHEPYGFLETLTPHDAIAPNCFWLGRSNHVQLHGWNISGISGIHVPGHTSKARPPIDQLEHHSNRAWIHFTHDDLYATLDHPPPDILILHEWPSDIIHPDDRPFFQSTRRSHDPNAVGSELLRDLIDTLCPQLVLCGHMHIAYRAHIQHPHHPPTAVVALGHVGHGDGDGSFAVFAYHPKTRTLFEDTEDGLQPLISKK